MPEWSNEVFAKNLLYYIESRGKSQREVADAVGVSAPTLNEWTKGKKLPRMGKIEKLANYFGCEKSDLIEDKKEQPTAQDDGLTENQRILMEFAKELSEEQAALALRVLKSLVEAD